MTSLNYGEKSKQLTLNLLHSIRQIDDIVAGCKRDWESGIWVVIYSITQLVLTFSIKNLIKKQITRNRIIGVELVFFENFNKEEIQGKQY